MIVVYIKENKFFKNVDPYGNIFDVKNEDIYIKENYKKVELLDIYKDCVFEDFNEDLTFNVVKYNSRKEKEKNIRLINDYKRKLSETDYKAIKYAEGVMSLDEYSPVKIEREMYRAKINELEKML